MTQARASPVHHGAHARDACGKTDEDGLAHQVMTDIELDDLGNRGDRTNIIIIEPVSGMDLEAKGRRLARAVGKPLELALARLPVARGRGPAIGAGMELDRVGPDLG